jgi:hypothetical protein
VVPARSAFWQLDEPEILRQFESSDVAYFEAEIDGDTVKIGRRVSEETFGTGARR